MDDQAKKNDEIEVTSHMLKKSYMSRGFAYIIDVIITIMFYPFFGVIWSIISGFIVTVIIFGLLFGWRKTLNSHYAYKCPNCGYGMCFSLSNKDAKLTDRKYEGRCPKCAKYHKVDYRYDGNMKILKD